MQCLEQDTSGIVSLFHEIFNPDLCNALARKHKFVQRSSSKLKGDEFIKLLTLPDIGVSEDSLNGLCIRLKKFNSNASLSASGLAQRINTPKAALMMQECYEILLKKRRLLITAQNPATADIFQKFTKVLIEDSTIIALNERLAPIFKGARGGLATSVSQLKIDLIYNFTEGVIADMHVVPGNIPDQGLSNRILSHLTKGDLIIRDLGYFSIQVFQRIEMASAYYLSRLPANVTIYLTANATEQLDLAKYLDQKFQNFGVIDVLVFVGTERMPARLVAYRAPEDVINARLRKANKRGKHRSTHMTAKKKSLLRFSLFITNVPVEMMAANIIGTIYRVRWEIELVFKQWKSVLKIDILKGISETRIKCLLWGRLCTVMLLSILCSTCMRISQLKYQRELSPTKLLQFLQRDGKLCKALIANAITELIEEIVLMLPSRLLKDKRGRRTLRERVSESEVYNVTNKFSPYDAI